MREIHILTVIMYQSNLDWLGLNYFLLCKFVLTNLNTHINLSGKHSFIVLRLSGRLENS
jgi:hypothetical protein